jgi:hypothetical protein
MIGLLMMLVRSIGSRADASSSTGSLLAKLGDVLARLSTTRAANLDNIDTTVTSRLGSIKTLQKGTLTYNGTATITSVTTAKSILTYDGDDNLQNTSGHRLEFTNATTITGFMAQGVGDEVARFTVQEHN